MDIEDGHERRQRTCNQRGHQRGWQRTDTIWAERELKGVGFRVAAAARQAAGAPATNVTSSAVGSTLNTMDDRMKLMPRVPRSITRFSAPVWRSRWNFRSSACRCANTRLATSRMVPCVICAPHAPAVGAHGKTQPGFILESRAGSAASENGLN